ncbi:hypothetical protein [Modestobacter altitudinis]|uniref:hypothetical protein n=1 Tax=Modestobacter altitudinis TaxID=2213158 RepID=UPI00110CD117|nr:hypothetical protein [Modestobacter altitudinis]
MATTGTTSLKPPPVWSALIGLTSLGVLLQALWAGLFLRPDADGSTWYSVHQHGAEATVTLAAIATVAAVVWLRHRRDLLIGTVMLLVLLVVEYVLGRAGGGSVVVHVPLAVLLMGLAVWLPMAARRR